MKLELKHLAPYLPYGLKFANVYFKPYKTENINIHQFNTDFSLNLYELHKPILRPISDLTKDELSIFSSSFKSWYLAKEFSFDFVWKIDLELCFKYHIDVFDLITIGLAVSIHDVGQVVA